MRNYNVEFINDDSFSFCHKIQQHCVELCFVSSFFMMLRCIEICAPQGTRQR